MVKLRAKVATQHNAIHLGTVAATGGRHAWVAGMLGGTSEGAGAIRGKARFDDTQILAAARAFENASNNKTRWTTSQGVGEAEKGRRAAPLEAIARVVDKEKLRRAQESGGWGTSSHKPTAAQSRLKKKKKKKGGLGAKVEGGADDDGRIVTVQHV